MTNINNDPKKEAKEKFRKIVAEDMKTMFAQTLSTTEVDKAVIQEIGDVLGEMTTMNNIASDTIEDSAIALKKIKVLEKELGDLEKQRVVREELDQAA